MKRGRDDDKAMDPLFPRLHVNDADKGGPRAPPRNKMALYEQLSIPSQRFGTTDGPSLPLRPHHAGRLVPSVSPRQDYGKERSVLPPFYISSHAASHAIGGVHKHSARSDLNSTGTELEKKFPKFVSQRMPHTAGNLQKNGKFDLKSPTIVQKSDSKLLEHWSASTFMSDKLERCSDEGKAKEAAMQIKSVRSKSDLVSREKSSTPSNVSKPSSNEQCPCGKSKELESPHCGVASAHQEPDGPFEGAKFLNDEKNMGRQDTTNVKSGSYCQMPPEDSCRGASLTEHENPFCDYRINPIGEGSHGNISPGDPCKITSSGDAKEHPLVDANQNDDSETSIVDSLSGVGISPDDVVGVIGSKHFWKARRAIVNQQRVFALQVFELHRLMKVQKLIAESPHLLFDESFYLGGSLPTAPVKSQHIDKDKEVSPNVYRNRESPEANTSQYPYAQLKDKHSEESSDKTQRNGFCSGNLSTAPELDNKPWSFHTPSNQWLVPVMSPTEGLIYKPFTGPSPPPGALMAPMYDGCGTISLPPSSGDFVCPAYRVPSSHKQQSLAVVPGAPAVAPSFFPSPFGLPVANHLASRTPVKQVGSFAALWGSGQKGQHFQSSCVMSTPKSDSLSEHTRRVQVAKDDDVQGSTASSPHKRVQKGEDAERRLPAALVEVCPPSHCRDQQPRVIKVVPHNRRTATESAARIFQSIQKERQRRDSV